METATDLTGRAADVFLERGILGALVVILAVALVATVFFMWRELKSERKASAVVLAARDAEIAEKDKLIIKILEDWRNDTRTSLGSITAALETVRNLASGTATRRH